MGCSPLLALMLQASLAIFLKRLVQSLPRRVIMLHSRDGPPAAAVELDPLYIEDHRFQVGSFEHRLRARRRPSWPRSSTIE
jgi:hypothetical protein